MNAILKCSSCGNESKVSDYNIVRMGSCCYVCGRWNGLSEMLENSYGEHVGKVARKELGWLNRVGERPSSDLRNAIYAVELLIEQAIRESGLRETFRLAKSVA